MRDAGGHAGDTSGTAGAGCRRSRAVPGVTRADLVTAAVVYVVPLAGVTLLLTLAGLGGLAVALLAVEALVAGAVVVARRRPPRPAGPAPASRRPWLVPLVMLAVLAGIVGVAVLASHGG